MNLFNIMTGQWDEENFIIATQLSEKQVRSVIQPMIDDARDGDFVYNPEDYVQVLRDAYPKSVILSEYGDIQEIVF